MGKSSNQPAKTILVSISILHASGRDVLSGILQRLDASKGWTIKLMQKEENPLTAAEVDAAETNGVAGLIVCVGEDASVVAALRRCRLPVVTIGWADASTFPADARRRTYIINDGVGIGALGAQHYLSKGRFRSYGFIGNDYLRNRETSFRKTLGAAAAEYARFLSHNHPGNDDDLDALGAWLAALPKPAAVMAGCDWLGVKALAACQRAGLKVPSQISLIGVDNDEFVCEHTTPQLSSILPGHFEMGRRAVIELEKLLKARRPAPPKSIVIPPVKLIERDSSTTVPPAADLVRRAKKFIVQNACDGIGVAEVVEHLRVSRRLLEIRYRALEGETVRTAIERVRFARLQRLLSTTKRKISLVAAECGYPDASVIARLFRQRTGLSMSAFRGRSDPRPSE